MKEFFGNRLESPFLTLKKVIGSAIMFLPQLIKLEILEIEYFTMNLFHGD
jgi:hypothetical protein